MDDLADRLSKVERRLESIENKLDRILCSHERTEQSCDRMNRHVDLVEGVYATVRSPLEFLRKKIAGPSERELPLIDSSVINVSIDNK